MNQISSTQLSQQATAILLLLIFRFGDRTKCVFDIGFRKLSLLAQATGVSVVLTHGNQGMGFLCG